DRVECELQKAVHIYPQLEAYEAAADLTLQVDATSALAPSTEFINPLTAGMFTLDLAANYSQVATRIYVQSFSVGLSGIRNRFVCPTRTAAGIDLDSDLAIIDTVENGLKSVRHAGKIGHFNSFGGTVS